VSRRWRTLLPQSVRARLGARRERALERYARGRGYDLVRRGFYSPIPDPAELPPETWTRRSRLEGIAFDTDAQARFVVDRIGPHMREFDPAFETGTSFGRFDIGNGAYEEVDSPLLHAMVRFLRPKRVVELGSGFSSLILGHALEANRADGAPSEYRVFDPYPRPFIAEIPALTELRAVRAQDVPLAAFEALAEGDLLFVDTTHTVKVGSDVNRIVLDVLPRLEPGVVVHFHDVFIPWEYHREWIEGDYKWNEHFLLQAFLSMNPGYEVLISAQALVREHADPIRPLVTGLRESSAPSSFWIRSLPG
jgi:hypothetical protein